MLRPTPSLRRLSLALLALTVASLASATPARWLPNIDAFTQADAKQPPPQGAVLFIGSSSIVMWSTLAADFPEIPVINRGFGGSELADSVFYSDRIAIPYHPRVVVLYAGENDIAAGKSAEQVADDFAAFRLKIHAALPDARLFYLSIKLSPSRAKLASEMLRANELIAAYCTAHPECTFVDVTTPMLDAAGHPRPELFRPDMLHMLPAGYAIWTKILTPLLKP
jgi:lysophospholipase L1-like esterase